MRAFYKNRIVKGSKNLCRGCLGVENATRKGWIEGTSPSAGRRNETPKPSISSVPRLVIPKIGYARILFSRHGISFWGSDEKPYQTSLALFDQRRRVPNLRRKKHVPDS
jgi:hypothetical protein